MYKTIDPSFTRFGGRDDWVARRRGVTAGVTVRRLIAAERCAARLAGAQMYPARTNVHALFALALPRNANAFDRFQVFTDRIAHSRKRIMCENTSFRSLGRTRTCDTQFRKLMFYPTELRGHTVA